jgi:hypothetical protein
MTTVPPSAGTAAGGHPVSSHAVSGSTTTVTSEPTQQSVGELVGQLSEDASLLVRQELALAKAEVRQEATTAGKGAGLLGAAGMVGLVVLILLSLAAARALSEVMDLGWAYLIVGVVWAIVAAVLASAGRKLLKQANPTPERTMSTVREIPDTLKGHTA